MPDAWRAEHGAEDGGRAAEGAEELAAVSLLSAKMIVKLDHHQRGKKPRQDHMLYEHELSGLRFVLEHLVTSPDISVDL